MADDEEWERILMHRESEMHRERAQRAALRDAMLKTKTLGYLGIGRADMALLKVLAGYLSGVGVLDSPGMLDAICLSVSRTTIAAHAHRVLSQRLRDADAIVKTLRSE